MGLMLQYVEMMLLLFHNLFISALIKRRTSAASLREEIISASFLSACLSDILKYEKQH